MAAAGKPRPGAGPSTHKHIYLHYQNLITLILIICKMYASVWKNSGVSPLVLLVRQENVAGFAKLLNLLAHRLCPATIMMSNFVREGGRGDSNCF